MLKIGLTGGIASGKTLVANMLAEMGATVIDTDMVARDVVEPETSGLSDIVNAFGPGVLTTAGQLDRRALRDLVFADAAKRQQLEALLHPRIRAATVAAMAKAAGPYLVVVVPLLVETDFGALVDRVLVVDCSVAIQIDRVTRRDNCSVADAKKILGTQASRQTRLDAADDVIENNGDLDELRQSVAKLHAQYLALAAN